MRAGRRPASVVGAHDRRRQAATEPHSRARFDAGIFLTAVYGGYFGAAQGVIFMALLGIFIDDHLQRLNAAKNVLAALVNGVAALLFMSSRRSPGCRRPCCRRVGDRAASSELKSDAACRRRHFGC